MCKTTEIIMILGFIIPLFIQSGCNSGGGNPFEPDSVVPVLENADPGAEDHHRIGQVSIALDLASGDVSVTNERVPEYHINATGFLSPPSCFDCIHIFATEFCPAENLVTLKVILKNPAPESVYDVRGIMLANEPGFKLLNADAYTDLWDDGGEISINPFMFFAQSIPHREFKPGATHYRFYEIAYPDYQELLKLTLVIDVCWPGNCMGPYNIEKEQVTGVFQDNQKVDIICEVQSWNAKEKKVEVTSLECLGYDEPVTMVPYEDDLWIAEDLYWHYNAEPPGVYEVLIKACNVSSSVNVFETLEITIEPTATPYGWAKSFGGSSSDRGYAITSTDSGNIYVGGYFNNYVDFDPGPGSYPILGQGGCDAFLCKYDPFGELLWVKTWGKGGSSSKIVILSIELDYIERIYITGFMSGGHYDLDPGDGIEWHSTFGCRDAFLISLDPYGQFLWARSWGGKFDDSGEEVAVDGFGDSYVTGYFEEIVNFDKYNTNENRTSTGGSDCYLVSFDLNGDFRWVRSWGTGNGNYNDDSGQDVVVDENQRVYITGKFGSTVDFDPNPGLDEHTSNGQYDAFFTCYNYMGEYLWTRTWGGIQTDEGVSVAAGSTGDLYICGRYSGVTDLDPGPGSWLAVNGGMKNAYVSKFSTPGAFLWGHSWGGPKNDEAFHVEAAGGDGAYVVGSFNDTVNFAIEDGEDLHTSAGEGDIYILKMNADGSYGWTATMGATGNDTAYEVTTDIYDDILLTGSFHGIVDFYPGEGVDERKAVAEDDVFFMRLHPLEIW
jgi:hypothetical protein